MTMDYLFKSVWSIIIKGKSLRLSYPLLLLKLHMFLYDIESDASLEISLDDRIRQFSEETLVIAELGIALRKIVHELECMQKRMILDSRTQQNLISLTTLSGIAASSRRKGTWTHIHTIRGGQTVRR